MSFLKRVKSQDLELLKDLAEYRLLTAKQITSLRGDQFGSEKSALRRLRQMVKSGMVATGSRGHGRKRGKPENLYTVGPEGFNLLVEESQLRKSLRYEQVNGEKIVAQDHQLLTNWFRLNLKQIEKQRPDLRTEFLAPNSPFSMGEDDIPVIQESFPPRTDGGKPHNFTPDGVFYITDLEQQKTLLFFLEVDMATETVASPKGMGEISFRRFSTIRSFSGLNDTSDTKRIGAASSTDSGFYLWLTLLRD